MTACEKMYNLLDKLLEQKKSLNEIGEYLCDSVEHPRLKAIRLIKQHKGEQYLKDNAGWLGYNLINADNRTVSGDTSVNKNVYESKPQPQPQPRPQPRANAPQPREQQVDYEPVVFTDESPDPDHCGCTPLKPLEEHQKRCTFCGRGIYDTKLNVWKIDYE
jgi:hypothetical protein